MTHIWCGIPVYNNSATIRDVVQRCRVQIPNIVVIDDGSTDGDLRKILEPLNIAVVRHPKNGGKGAALLTAFRYAAERGAEYLITLDGDGQHFPEDIPRLIARLTPNTLLIGTREEIVGTMPRSSRFGREFSDFWICVETGQPVRDTQSGFRAYPLPQVLHLKLCSQHYNLEMEIVTRAVWAGLHIAGVPIRVWYPDPMERISHFHPFRDNLRISLLHARLIVRQLLPIPHRRLPGLPRPQERTAVKWPHHFCRMNSSPFGLAAATALSMLLGIVLWPWGVIPALYLALRLHLNTIMAILLSLLCLPSILPTLCLKIGAMVLDPRTNPHMAWFVGSHIVAFILSPISALLVYIVARHFQTQPTPLTVNSR